MQWQVWMEVPLFKESRSVADENEILEYEIELGLKIISFCVASDERFDMLPKSLIC